MIRNVANQTVGAGMVSASTGAAFGGTVTVYVAGDGGAQVLGSVGAGVCTLEGNGYYTYHPSAGETNFSLVGFTFIGAGAIPQTVQLEPLTASQVSALQTATGGNSLPVATLIADAFREIAVFAPNATIPPDDFAFALGKLNRLLDNMTDDRRMTFADSFTAYTLIPGHNPHTIGPTAADWTTVTRPINIRAAQLVLTNVTPNVFLPVQIIDWQHWSQLSVRAIQTSTPLKLYYDAQWPNGNINLYPIPSTAYQLELVTRTNFASVGAADQFWLPPGYRDYVTLKLARALAPAYPGSAQISQQLQLDLAECEGRLFNANIKAPKLATADIGVPGSSGHAGEMNWRDRSFG